MKKNKTIKLFRKLHKWPGIVIVFFALLFVCSGIILNHRPLFSRVDVSRNLLPPGYQYKNWNLSSVRGGLNLDDGSHLLYGNIGVWKLQGTQFEDFNQGFPKGIDNRKIVKLLQFDDRLVAATQFGLYTRPIKAGIWSKVPIPIKEERLTDLFLKEDSLLVMSRHYLLKTVNVIEFDLIQLPAPIDYQREAGLFNTLWELHSGELLGLVGKLVVDLLGLVTILLAVTGLLHFFFPKIVRRRKKKQKDYSKLTATRKLNLRWHNVVGYTFVFFLLINTTAGIFLRPPLLIPIANTKVGIIPGTHLDNPNPWFDKLRRGTWNEALKSYMFSTSDGFYFADESLRTPLRKANVQPPVSVMGCNVLEPLGAASYLVGSFSGLFVWDINHQLVLDAFTQQAPQISSGRPISDHLVAGYVKLDENEHYLFDYDLGMQGLGNSFGIPMPDTVLDQSPISLWNAALEVHTGRIFEHLIGPFYILYVPLAGLCLIMVLVSGFLIWWKAYKK